MLTKWLSGSECIVQALKLAERALHAWQFQASTMAKIVEEIRMTLKLLLRPLAEDDLRKDFIPLLEQLSTVGHFTEDFFRERLEQVVGGDDIAMMVVEDTALNRIVGFGTVIIEPKFIHETGYVGHIEDVVIDRALRRKGLGTHMVECLTRVAKGKGCYKVIVDCSDANTVFYTSCNFQIKGACMTKYFERKQQTRLGAMSLLEVWVMTSLRVHVSLIYADANLTVALHIIDPYMQIKPEPYRQDFMFRCLAKSDYARGYLQLLEQLTTVGKLTQAQFESRLEEGSATGTHYFIVVENKQTGKLVAAGTLFLEQKFIRSAGLAGHIEDVVVDANARGQGLGRAIINYLRDLAGKLECYKCILDCDETNVGFYEKCGFSKGHSPVFMAKYF
eukprot:TRINITY_DN11189_c0_g2_i1.p1 TRINITY_DN11189_c0_g2~~TRINITY_DN11189_c0_g2_i1.p1  ORF type:complete len:390 (+),score=59.73 TRINITY_DN11189_c0_g2_i1:7-1176(+)